MHAVAKVKSIVLAFERCHKYVTTNATLDGEIVLRITITDVPIIVLYTYISLVLIVRYLLCYVGS